MKKIFLLLVITVITSLNAFGQAIPKQIDYQGVLKNAAGVIVPDGNYQLTFKIYNDPTGGSALWTEAQTVAVADGIFSAHLGSITPITTVPFNRIHFLGITVESDPELSPRTMLTPSPYSFMAMDVTDNTVVKSLNSLKDNVNLVAGSNITITPSGNDITISATGGGGGTIGGSGTTNYVPLFTNSTTIGNSILYQNNNKIGINNSSPDFALTINSDQAAGLGLKISRSNGGFGIALLEDSQPTGLRGWNFDVFNQKLTLKTAGDNGYSTIRDLITFDRNGNVGIGTTSPAYPLHINANNNTAATYSINLATDILSAGVYGEASQLDWYGVGGYFVGGWYGVYGSVIPSGSNGYIGVIGEVSGGTSPAGNRFGLYGTASGTGTGTRYGVYGTAQGGTTNWAGYFSGNVNVTGTLSKGGGSFKIDHPLDPANKYLYHSFVESPDMMNIYNGNIVTDGSGYATVTLPDWFEALNKDFRYQLTVIGDFAQAIIAQEVQGNQFAIRTDKPSIKVSWQVTGIRQDKFAEQNRIPVEEMKQGDEIGKYLYPDAFGLSETMGIDYEKNNSDRTSQSK